MRKIGILRSNMSLSHMANVVKSIGVGSQYYSWTFISYADGELEVGNLLRIGIQKFKVLHLGKYVRDRECLTGESVPGGRQFEIATDLNPDLAGDLIGEDVYLVGQANE